MICGQRCPTVRNMDRVSVKTRGSWFIEAEDTTRSLFNECKSSEFFCLMLLIDVKYY